MFRKMFWIGLALFGTLTLHAQEETAWRKNITMLVVPREPLAVQVAQDIAARYPVLLVCYQQTSRSLAIHAWDGATWVPVSAEDYTNGTFFAHRPRHTVIVESQDQPAPEVLTPNGAWCQNGNRLSSTDPRVIIHLLGRYFDFPYRYWVQFSKRYGYALEDINPSLINVYWWHYRGNKVRPAMNARDFDADMNNWHVLNITLPPPIKPVVIKEKIEIIPPAEIPAGNVVEAKKPDVENVKNVVIKETTTEPMKLPVVEKTPIEQTKPAPVPAKTPTPEETVEQILMTLMTDPFSSEEIPAAEVILPPPTD